jgi:hypothetical protein
MCHYTFAVTQMIEFARQYLEENIAGGKLTLSAEDVQAVRDVAARADAAQGERYPASMMAAMFADTPALP